MGTFKKDERVLVFKSKEYKSTEYLVDETFNYGTIIHYDDTTDKYWIRGENGNEYFGRWFYSNKDSDKKDNAIIISIDDFISAVYQRIIALSDIITRNMEVNIRLLKWFNANVGDVKNIDGKTIVYDYKTKKQKNVADFSETLEIGETVFAFDCKPKDGESELECILNLLIDDKNIVRARIVNILNGGDAPSYMASYGEKGDIDLIGNYAKAYQQTMYLRLCDFLRLILAKSKALKEKNRIDNQKLRKLQDLYHKLAGDAIGNQGYVPPVIAEYAEKPFSKN